MDLISLLSKLTYDTLISLFYIDAN